MITFLAAKKIQLQLGKPEGWSTEYNPQNPLRVLLEKLTGFQPAKKFPHFMEPKVSLPHSQMSATCLYSSQLNPVHTPTSYFLRIHINIILLSKPGFSKCSLSLKVSPPKTYICLSSPHMCYMPRPSDSSRFYQPNNIGLGQQIIKLLIK